MEFKFAPGVVVPQNGGGNNGSERLEEMVKVTSNSFLRTPPSPPPPPERAAVEEGGEEDDEDKEIPDLIDMADYQKPKKKRAKANSPLSWPAGGGPAEAGQRGGSGVVCLSTLLYFLLTVAFFTSFGFVVIMYAPKFAWFPDTHSNAPRKVSFPLWPSNVPRKGMKFSSTSSVPRHILADLEYSLYSHLSSAPNTFSCLCMHHLQTNNLPLQKICALYNPYMERVHLLTEPRIVGHGELTDLYEERLISADAVKTNVKRYRTVFVQWSDAGTGDVLTLQLQGMQAVCMQVAVEEFSVSAAA